MGGAIGPFTLSTLTLATVELTHYRSAFSLLVVRNTCLRHLYAYKLWTEIMSRTTRVSRPAIRLAVHIHKSLHGLSSLLRGIFGQHYHAWHEGNGLQQ